MPLTVNQNQVKHVARIRLGSHILESLMDSIRAEYERYALGDGDEEELTALLESAKQVIQSTAAQWSALRSATGF